MVSGDDGADDGQAQPGAAGGAGTGTVAAGEPLEHGREKIRWDAGSVVEHGEHGKARGAGVQARGDRRAGRGVGAGVGEQVGQHLVQAGRVAGDDHRLVGQLELPAVVGPGGVGVAHRVHDESGQIDRFGVEGTSGVQPREEQQVLDQAGHPGRFGLHPAQRVGDVGGHPVAAAAGQLGVSADGGQRSPQFVAGVRDELTDLHLAGLACRECRADVAEHAVERRADLTDLGTWVGVRLRDALSQRDLAAVQRQLGDPPGGGRHASQRPKREADDGRAGERGGEQSDPGDGGSDDSQLGEGRLDGA